MPLMFLLLPGSIFREIEQSLIKSSLTSTRTKVIINRFAICRLAGGGQTYQPYESNRCTIESARINALIRIHSPLGKGWEAAHALDVRRQFRYRSTFGSAAANAESAATTGANAADCAAAS